MNKMNRSKKCLSLLLSFVMFCGMICGINIGNFDVVYGASMATVQFYNNGGLYNGSPNNPNLFSTEIGKTIPQPKPGEFTRTNYALEGWYTTKAGADSLNASLKWNFANPVQSNLTLYAGWVVNVPPQQITFRLNDRFGSASGTVVRDAHFNGANVSPNNASGINGTFHGAAGGANFDGWYTSSNFTSRFTSIGYTSAEPKTIDLYARYSRSLQFIQNGNTTTRTIYLDQTAPLYTVPSTADILMVETINGVNVSVPYEFKGWFTVNGTQFNTSTGSVQNLSFNSSGVASLHARYEKKPAVNHVVTLRYNNGSNPGSISFEVPNGSRLSLANPAAKTGTSFAGWYRGDTQWSSTNTVTSSIVLDAKYSYKVQFVLNGGKINGSSTLAAVNVLEGGYLSKPSPDPVFSGYTFVGWYSSATNKKVEFDSSNRSVDPITSSQTLNATYDRIPTTPTPKPEPTDRPEPTPTTEPKPTTDPKPTTVPIVRVEITYDVNGGSPAYTGTQYVRRLSIFPNVVNPVPTKSGHVLDGWYYDGKKWDFDSNVAEVSMTLKAEWLIDYMVEFWTGPGTNLNMRQEAMNITEKSFIPGIQDPVKPGQKFLGWEYTEHQSQQKKIWDGKSQFPLTKEIGGPAAGGNTKFRLDAIFSANPLVTLIYDNGTGRAETVATYERDSAFYFFFPTSNPTKPGHTFEGWFDSDGNSYDDNTPINDNIVLTARWALSDITIYFEPNDSENAVKAVPATFGSKVNPPLFPEKEKNGMTLRITEWYRNPDYSGAPINFNTYIAQYDETLYGKWNIDTPITITFMDPYNVSLGTITVPYGTSIDRRETPLPNDSRYIFQNDWFYDYEKRYTWDFNDPFTTNTTLTASVAHTVTFNSNGGSSVASKYILRGQDMTPPEPPSKSGYVFGGWYTDSTLTQRWLFIGDNPTNIVNGHLTLYAKWVQNNPPEIRGNANQLSVFVGDTGELAIPIWDDGKPSGYLMYELNMKDGSQLPAGISHTLGSTWTTNPDGSLSDFFKITFNPRVLQAGQVYELTLTVRDGELSASKDFILSALRIPLGEVSEITLEKDDIEYEGIISQSAATISFCIPEDVYVGNQFIGTLKKLAAEGEVEIFSTGGSKVWLPCEQDEGIEIRTGYLLRVKDGKEYSILILVQNQIQRIVIDSYVGEIDRKEATITFNIPEDKIVDGRFGGTLTEFSANGNAAIFIIDGIEYRRQQGQAAGFVTGDKICAESGVVYTLIIKEIEVPKLPNQIEKIRLDTNMDSYAGVIDHAENTITFFVPEFELINNVFRGSLSQLVAEENTVIFKVQSDGYSGSYERSMEGQRDVGIETNDWVYVDESKIYTIIFSTGKPIEKISLDSNMDSYSGVINDAEATITFFVPEFELINNSFSGRLSELDPGETVAFLVQGDNFSFPYKRSVEGLRDLTIETGSRAYVEGGKVYTIVLSTGRPIEKISIGDYDGEIDNHNGTIAFHVPESALDGSRLAGSLTALDPAEKDVTFLVQGDGYSTPHKRSLEGRRDVIIETDDMIYVDGGKVYKIVISIEEQYVN